MSISKKNGEIEFLRFFFAMMIVLFHFNATRSPRISLGYHGNIGVEFFFLVSGVLLAKTISQQRENVTDLAKFTWHNVWKKVKPILPWHFFAIFLKILHDLMRWWDEPITLLKAFVKFIPDIFFLHSFGFLQVSRMATEWYVSVLLISIIILVPFMVKHGDFFEKIIAPFLSLFIIGYIYTFGSKLSGVELWCGVVPKMVLRGIAEMMLGIFLYHLTQYIMATKATKKRTFLMGCKIIEISSLICVIVYTNLKQMSDKYEILELFFLMAGVTLCFSEILPIGPIYNSKISVYLGKLALPLYLLHPPIISLVNELCPAYSENQRMVLVVVISLILSCLGLCLIELHTKKERNRIQS